MVEAPSFEQETRLWNKGYARIAGLDEAGRGALAGPVVAGAVIIAPDAMQAECWCHVRDSKLLSQAQREALFEPIQATALAWGIGAVGAAAIDIIGIAAATRTAMQQAIANLAVRPDYLLIDWVKLPLVNLPQSSTSKADRRIVSVAAASILAKVYRDHLMCGLSAIYPNYGFADHKGYGAPAHLAALAQYGPCPEHRHSFSPISHAAGLFDG